MSNIASQALWQWDTTGPSPVVTGYPQAGGVFGPTKTGLMPADLRAFAGVPLQNYGNPPTLIPDAQLLGWIRQAEDQIEQKSGVLLCQTWVASPPAVNANDANSMGIAPVGLGYQRRGFDYDLADAGYDFFIQNSEDNGWTIQQLRYKPVQSLNTTPTDPTAVKLVAYRYPLLNTYFVPARSWFVEDHDAGLLRLVPSGNIAMLPIFQMQLTALGWSDNIPGGLWIQYTAGLVPYDYQSRYAFILQLVLATAVLPALRTAQGTINLGMKGIQTSVDGLMQRFEYDVNGPYAGLIASFDAQRADLMNTLMTRVGGFLVTVL